MVGFVVVHRWMAGWPRMMMAMLLMVAVLLSFPAFCVLVNGYGLPTDGLLLLFGSLMSECFMIITCNLCRCGVCWDAAVFFFFCFRCSFSILCYVDFFVSCWCGHLSSYLFPVIF